MKIIYKNCNHMTSNPKILEYDMEIDNGYVELILGPMFSGKSTMMVHKIDRQVWAKKKCVIIRHAIDKRYDEISTTGIVLNNRYVYTGCPVIKVENLKEA